jgi:hypothetical protein
MLSRLHWLESRSEPPSNSNAPSILAIEGAFTGTALAVVILRIYVRTAMLKFIGSDDYAIVAAMESNSQSSVSFL